MKSNSQATKAVQKKYFSKYKEPLVPFPNLIENQVNSFDWFATTAVKDIFKEFSPIEDYAGKKFSLEIKSFSIGEPKCDEYTAKENKLTYEAQIKARIVLHNKSLGIEKEQEVFMADLPLMTSHGTFIINGVERVIVPQISRSTGVSFFDEEIKGRRFFGAKIIPGRGVWIEVESDSDGLIYVRVDKKKKFLITELLRVRGLFTDEMIKKAFTSEEALKVINLCLEKDSSKTVQEAYLDIYKKLRDGDLASPDHAKEELDKIFSKERYNFSDVGRFQFNKRFDLPVDGKDDLDTSLLARDLVAIIEHIVKLNNTHDAVADDIDNLASRRVKYVGEMLLQNMRIGMTRIKRNVQDRMSTMDANTSLPIQILNQRPLQIAIKQFFAQNPLSQFMEQENLLSEVEHLRTVSALGPGGLTRERAGLPVRDVHTSHYGRVCPIHTPEGANIGLILRLSTYAKINDFGIIETPYIRVKNGKLTKEVVYLNALEEEKYNIAHAGVAYDKEGNLINEMCEARIKTRPGFVEKNLIDFIDVATNQAFSIATSMIPFLDHDNGNRALMGSNMQKQAQPLVSPEYPLVATGMEEHAARFSGRLLYALQDGIISYVDSDKIIITDDKDKKHEYNLVNFSRTNKFTSFHHVPFVHKDQKIKKGDLLADTSTSVSGQVSLGQNALVAFLSWNGQNYEDAIILSERLIKNSKFTSIHIEEFTCVVRDTKLGPEITTRDIPNVGEAKLKDLDEDGIIRIGAEVRDGDILVGKITPKGETELTPEERLLRSIFSEKARDVKDTSLRLEHGKKGRIVKIKIFSRDEGHSLESGVLKKIVIEVAQLRNIAVGDKLSGRHGNKGVVSIVLPEEDMPYMADGTPVDVVLTPLGIPSRMNLGQILEMHLGYAADKLGYQAIVPSFAGATINEIQDELEKAGMPRTGRVPLFDGRTGDGFKGDVAVGRMYILKLHHMVEDKVTARSVGPYSLITQQPLGGRSQGGGQRFGEMEVWALEGYGAAYTLREMLTIKSDDIKGRTQAYDSIIRGEKIKQPNKPASFSVMLSYLRGLALDVTLLNDNNQKVEVENN